MRNPSLEHSTQIAEYRTTGHGFSAEYAVGASRLTLRPLWLGSLMGCCGCPSWEVGSEVIVANILVEAFLDFRVTHNCAFLSPNYDSEVSVSQNPLLQKTAQ